MDGQLNPDTTLTVFVGRGRISHGIRQTLEDFTATGLIQDLAWVDADAFASSSSEVTYLSLCEDGTPQITREPFNTLVARLNIGRLHLGVINVVGLTEGAISSVELQELLDAIDSILTGPRIERTNLMISAVDAPLEGDLPTLRGYTNLFLAPEDSPGPEAATVPFHFDALDNRFTLHCVAGIASLFGLWEGSRSAPVARLEPASGGTFRMVRAFYRRIDGQEVQARLKARIFDTSHNPLPQLNRPGQVTQYTEDPVAFTENAAEDLLAEFNERIEGRRADAMAEKTRHMKSTSALGKFLRVWAKGMINTPARFLRELKGETRSLLDDTVQSTIYGKGSRTHVGGYRAESGGTAEVEAQRGPRQETLRLEATRELGTLWAAYANTAMSLLDASPRHIAESTETSYPRVVREHAEGDVWVAPSASVVIPGPDANFGRDLPVEVKSTVGGGDIAPYDLLGVTDYERRLSDQRHGGQREVGRVIGEFKQWQEENSESFAYFFGRGLVDRRSRLEQRRTALGQRISELENHRTEVEETGAAAGVFRWLGWVFMSSLVIFAALWGSANLRTEYFDELLWGWAANLNAASATTKWWMFGVWAGLWILCWMTQVAFETRDEIRFRHRRRTVVSELEAARVNRRETDRALLRLDVGYRQFLSTSQMIGALLNEPFGRIRHPRVESTIPVNTMPESVVFAEAAPGCAAVDALADTFRRDLYREGWLNDYVLGGLAQAMQTSEARSNGKTSVSEVFFTSGRGSQGALARLADTVSGGSFRERDRGKEKWRSITRQLRDDSRLNNANILSPLQIYRAGKQETASPRMPLDQVRIVGAFNGEIATEKGRVEGVLDLDPTYCTYDRNSNTFDAIGVSEVLVQIGGPAFQGDVAFRRPERATLSEDILRGMPVSEDFQSPERPTMLTPQPRHQLPGTGEF
ncbi:hypothetical protein [Corynebacterium comes]|uniref:Uncharacterized protein n=1 Tax=Corynebacterium comes TaxID=2675218 RepID=A0A6B8VR89_9CORY|nr:hypothetical protein [Corynebacterium comes]QGU05579.1 hypothetical protein CETAM_11735 [Corynebacterium comes]